LKQWGLECPHPSHCNFGGQFGAWWWGGGGGVAQAGPLRAMRIKYKWTAVAFGVKREQRQSHKGGNILLYCI